MNTLLKKILRDWILLISKEDTEINLDIIIAINFGLFETSKGYNVYAIGSKEYDVEDDEWACNEDYVPNNKYCQLSDMDNLNWEEIQKEIVEALSQIIKEEKNIK